MQNQIKLIAYWMYLWAVISLAGIYWASGVVEIVIAFILAALFYHSGTGIIKLKNRERIIAIVLLAIFILSDINIILSVVSNTAANSQTQLIAGVSLLILIVSSLSVYYLFKRDVVKIFKENNNKNA